MPNNLLYAKLKKSTEYSSCLLLLLCYVCISTGFTFQFYEIPNWPNYGMLTEAFNAGRTYISASPAEDYLQLQGRKYLYYGPVPALIRLIFSPMTSIPTGFFIAIWMTGIMVLSLKVFEIGSEQDGLSPWMWVLLALNGISVFMVGVPSIHHEAILTAMFFLIAALYIFLKSISRNEQKTICWVLMGLFLGLSIGSRFSYFPACILLILMAISGYPITSFGKNTERNLLNKLVLLLIFGSILTGLLFYNYIRFNDPLEFGLRYQVSLYEHDQFISYEHLPYNIWSYFFRLPTLVDYFPYLLLPFFSIKADHIGFPPFHFTYANEFAVSVFILLPVLFAIFIPFTRRLQIDNTSQRNIFIVLTWVIILQILSDALSIATILRFYFDFLPLLAVLAFLYIACLQPRYRRIVKFLVIFSIIFSNIVIGYAFFQYCGMMEIPSPWLRFL